MVEKAALLPVWSTVKKSYQMAWQYRWEYLRISWLWLVLAVPVIFVVGSLQPSLSAISCFLKHLEPITKEVDPHPMQTFVLPWVSKIFITFLGASIAVAWHRLILRNEKVATQYYLRFDKVVWNYLILVVFIAAIPIIKDIILGFPVLLAYVLSKSATDYLFKSTTGNLLLAVAVIIATIVAWFFMIRISVLLPAKALGVNISIKEGWPKTNGNFWRISFGDILCFLPSIFLLPLLLLLKLGCGSVLIGATVYTFIVILDLLITLPIYLSFLSLSYQHFFKKKEAE